MKEKSKLHYHYPGPIGDKCKTDAQTLTESSRENVFNFSVQLQVSTSKEFGPQYLKNRENCIDQLSPTVLLPTITVQPAAPVDDRDILLKDTQHPSKQKIQIY